MAFDNVLTKVLLDKVVFKVISCSLVVLVQSSDKSRSVSERGINEIGRFAGMTVHFQGHSSGRRIQRQAGSFSGVYQTLHAL